MYYDEEYEIFKENYMNLIALLDAAEGTQKQNPLYTYIFLGAIIVLFIVFLVINNRKAKKKEEETKCMLDAIKPGDEIRTIGGIFGKVKMVKEDLVTITTGPKDDEMVFAKGAIEFVTTQEDKAKMAELENEADEDDTDEKPKKKSIFSRKK